MFNGLLKQWLVRTGPSFGIRRHDGTRRCWRCGLGSHARARRSGLCRRRGCRNLGRRCGGNVVVRRGTIWVGNQRLFRAGRTDDHRTSTAGADAEHLLAVRATELNRHGRVRNRGKVQGTWKGSGRPDFRRLCDMVVRVQNDGRHRSTSPRHSVSGLLITPTR